jgi:hypothetical protein
MSEKEFIHKHAEQLSKELRRFPDDFLVNIECMDFELPGKTLILGEEFFGRFEIITPDGTPVLHIDDFDKANYIVYASRSKQDKIKIPLKKEFIKQVLDSYRNYLDNLVKKLEHEFKESFPASKNFNAASSAIFKKLNIVRH